MTITEMRVHMDCRGCEAKIRKALQKLRGVDDVDIDMGMQKVTVMGWVEQKKVLKAVRKTGRRVELWPYPYNPEFLYNQQYYYMNYQLQQQQQRRRRRQHQITQNQPVTYDYYNYDATDHDDHQTSTSSSYKYPKHGYNDFDYTYGYYQPPPYSTILDDKATAMFSDDNPNACSIM